MTVEKQIAEINQGDIMAEISKYMVQFGCTHIVVWSQEGVTNGAH